MSGITFSFFLSDCNIIPENNIFGQHDHILLSTDVFQFSVSLIALYSYR